MYGSTLKGSFEYFFVVIFMFTKFSYFLSKINKWELNLSRRIKMQQILKRERERVRGGRDKEKTR